MQPFGGLLLAARPQHRNPSAAFSSAVTSTLAVCLASLRATPSRFTTAAAFFATSPSRTTPSNASRNTVYTERTDEPAARGPRT